MIAGLAAAGVVTGALTVGGVALASTGSAGPATAAVTTATTATAGLTVDGCDDGIGWMSGVRDGQQPVLKAAASYLGLTEAKLADQSRAGKSLAGVAAARDKSVSGLKNAILAAVTSRINASTGLTAAQKTELIARVKSHLAAMVSATPPVGAGMRWADTPMRDGGGPWDGMGAGARGYQGGM